VLLISNVLMRGRAPVPFVLLALIQSKLSQVTALGIQKSGHNWS